MRKAHNRVEYQEGQLMNNCLFLKEIEPRFSAGQYRRKAKFVCSCGEIFEAVIDRVKGCKTDTSCGCTKKSILAALRTTHGGRLRSEYSVWCGIKERCYNSNNKRFKYYGGRGIFMSDEWKNDFQKFIDDMGDRPSAKHTIDRIDNDKGYCKENCRWATLVEQANNKSTNVFIEYNGETKTLAQWAVHLNLRYSLIRKRIQFFKWTPHEAFTTPARKFNKSLN